MSPQPTTIGRCVICGAEGIQRNHPGGQNHIAWFTQPCCVPHHDQFHALCRAAGINLEYTDDPVERNIRAQEAGLVFQWMLLQAQRELHNREAQCEKAS